MKLRILLSVGSVTLVVAFFWAYQIYMAQLNNAIALQRCVLEIERERRFTGRLPRSVDCAPLASTRPARKCAAEERARATSKALSKNRQLCRTRDFVENSQRQAIRAIARRHSRRLAPAPHGRDNRKCGE